jgi:hypothetical protein
MATQEMILKLLFNDDGTFAGLEEINKQLEKTDKNTQKVEEATKTLAQQYKILKKEQDLFDPGTEKFNELSIKMGELRDRMNDAADAVRANTGPAIEGMSNSFGLMGEQLSNLDFEGLTQSIQLFSGNLARIDTKALTGGLKAAFQAGVQGLKVLGKAVLANPLLGIIAVLVGIIAYWKEIGDFVTGKGKMLENLKAQAEALKSQEQTLTRELALQKALGAGAGQILRTELELLKNKQKQAEVAMKIAYAEKNREEFLAAQQAQLQAINELEMRKVKINQDAQALLDKIRSSTDDQYNKQVLQNQAFSEYKKATEELSVLQQINNERARQINTEIAAARQAGNNALADQLVLERESLKLQNISLQNNKDEIWNAGEAAKDNVKTEKELEAIAKAKADAEAKKIQEDALEVDKRLDAIEKERADAKKTDLNREIDDTLALQKTEEEAYKKANKSEKELQDLKIRHSQELQGLLEKYAKLEQELADEAAKKLRELQQEGINQKQAELIELQSIIDEADEANFQNTLSKQEQELMAQQEYYFQLKTQAEAAGLDATALVEEQARKENEIKEKYRKEDEAKRMANIQSNFDMAGLALDALSSLNEASAKGDEASQRKVFERNKMIQKAQATIAMASGIVQQLAVPQDQLTGMNFAKAAALAAAGIANIVKINQTQFGGSTPSPSGGNLTAPSASNAPAIDFSAANLQTNAPGGLETYVLAGNVANALEARQKIIDQSYL